MKILLKPIDTLFFRDGKPFSMGDESWANGVLLPYPSTLYGSIKTLYYSINPDKFDLAINNNEDPAADVLEIQSIYYKYENRTYFPMPLDFAYPKGKKVQEKRREKRENSFVCKLFENFRGQHLSSANNLQLTLNKEEVETIEDGIIGENDFIRYLMDVINELSVKKLSNIVTPEPKVGIGRNNTTHTTEESKLYRIGMGRYKELAIGVELKEEIGLKNTLSKLGGEGKVVKVLEDTDELKIRKIDFDKINETYKFKLYLSTPAIFENGWLPKWIDEKTGVGEINGLEIKLITTFIGKPVLIGGFNMAERKPKVMRKAVPAGSVYYFELSKGNASLLENTFHNKSISELSTAKEGFGITYLGVLK